MFLLLSVAATYGWRVLVDQEIGYQKNRNDYLRKEIAKIDEKLKEIAALDRTKERILSRMEVIQDLQRLRPAAVHLMDELVFAMPDGVYLDDISQQGTAVTLKGAAESNARVSALMRNVQASGWMEDPRLNVVENKQQDKAAAMNSFQMKIRQKMPKQETELDEEGMTGKQTAKVEG
ncbi:MAG: PilN domain-containing protein [Pseudomonadota bacterium]